MHQECDRKTWVHVSHIQNGHKGTLTHYLNQNETQVKPGDLVSISLPLWNLMGQVNVEQLECSAPKLIRVPDNVHDFMSYERSN